MSMEAVIMPMRMRAKKTKTTYQVQTTTGRVCMEFDTQFRALQWARNQRKQHGAAAPTMHIVTNTVVTTQETIEYV